MCVWQPLVYDVQSLSGDLYFGQKIEQRVCLKCCVSNVITAAESLKMLQKCFGESTLSRTQVFDWHKASSEGREVVLARTEEPQFFAKRTSFQPHCD